MDRVIRNESNLAVPRKVPRSAIAWLCILLILTVFSFWLAIRFSDILGSAAGFLLGAIAVFALGIGTFVFFRRPDVVALDVDRRVNSGLGEAFDLSPIPSLLTRNGKPSRSNEAYMELAKALGRVGLSGGAPSVETLFEACDRDATAAVFRLHHLKPPNTRGEETIDMILKDGSVKRFKIIVIIIDSGRLWQVQDVSDENVRAESLLSQVSIGLFCADQDGRVVTTNENLDTWVGVAEGARPEYVREFLENPEVLLNSPKTPGRTIRADTRLITHKGAVTPAVMVANWREIGPDRYVAHVALHGHSSLGLNRNVQSESTGASAGVSLPAMAAGDVASAPIAILELGGTDLSTARIQRANEAFSVMSDRRDWNDRLFKDVFQATGDDLAFLEKDATECLPGAPYDAVLYGKNGVSVSVYIVADKDQGISRVFLVDISARKSLEDQLVQSQKMQAIGRLVAEIAHDFNNLLAAMRLYTDTLLGRHPIGDPSYAELQQINSNVNRAASLVKKLLAYSRKQTLRAVKVDVAETLSDIAVTLKQVLGERVEFGMVHGRNLPPIKVDKSQLDTVLMNLAVNARDAMKAQGGGKITIESRLLSKSDIQKAGLRNALGAIDSEKFVVIAVSDTGTGITDEIKSKIFEPFFTTKPQGEGTGLGLSTVYGIVEQSGGHLDVESELGIGTTFSVYLPAFYGAEEPEAQRAEARLPAATRPPEDLAGQGNILFVEDEDSVRVIAAKTLRKRGYNVVEACDGDEAFEIIEESEARFDLMISDVVMPGMDGPTLLKKARPMLENTRIVFISGYAEEEFSDLLSEEPDVTFLPKPFSLVQLAEKVKAEIGVSS